ncbi:hypothetical protein Pmar_PMAR022296 [Perkinsus marinus ATCC 50983]|uniref:Uncharacterized protein n=1 Tax=Perkinsus marinus (strain ATCC 50983 / TXsc) TaxID=423536 RepID=C5KDQ0_PERM5|nr:hypothetical protein Pmar_PMAR022296 [Perkinsus marinus ATCC 50983]EER17353.1 hypothetical protein Pmar_PMAR022296 [Perkinsus marinus ATCC 50983]|eukprot:XP_002785557.1 hypothetical protein Pmar_PMAR022296 [Perkinsus marinus ATCC 50983]
MITAAAETEEGAVPEEPLSGNEPLEATTLNAEVDDDDDDTLTLKEIRCRRFSHKVASLLSSSGAVGDGNAINPKTGTTGLPPFLRSYGSTSKREERLMHFLEEFEIKFRQTYGGERKLYLCPSNEIGVPKFLPTTIRPFKLAYPELYDAGACAKFLADHIVYEELKDPGEFPAVVCSPSTTLFYQAGDAFDISVVQRKGGGSSGVVEEEKMIKKYVDLLDLRQLATEEVEEDISESLEMHHRGSIDENRNESAESAEKTIGEDFSLGKKFIIESEFVKGEENREALLEERAAYEAERSDSDDELTEDEEEMDAIAATAANIKELGNAAAGQGEEAQPSKFIGRRSSVEEHIVGLWYGKEREVWYVICLLSPPRGWCSLLKRNQPVLQPSRGDSRRAQEEVEMNANTIPLEHLIGVYDISRPLTVDDLPPSWTSPAVITRERYATRFCDKGVKIEKYLKATLEEFSVGSQPDGMVQRVTRFKDIRMRIPVMITEIFKQRKDSLQTRIKYLGDAAIREEFDHGRSSALKVLVDIDERVRIMEYYHEGRADRLERTVEKIGEKIKEYFIDRDDMLEYHSVKLDRELMGSVVGRSLPSLPIGEYVNGKIVFHLPKKCIRITYHRPEGRLMGQQLTFYKTPDGQSLTLDKLSRIGAGDDIKLPTPMQLLQLLKLEKTAKHSFIETTNQITSEMVLRRKEENKVKNVRLMSQNEGVQKASAAAAIADFAGPPVDVGKSAHNKGGDTVASQRNLVLMKNVYDYARGALAEVTPLEDGSEEYGEDSATKIAEKKMDILMPYLAEFRGEQLDALQAEFVVKKCKSDFRKRLLDRAAVIQKRLEEEQEALKKRRAQIQRRGGPEIQQGRAESDFEQYQTLAMFRIQILEQRLARHEIQAIKKFTELEEALLTDPRLQAMWEKESSGFGDVDEDEEEELCGSSHAEGK